MAERWFESGSHSWVAACTPADQLPVVAVAAASEWPSAPTASAVRKALGRARVRESLAAAAGYEGLWQCSSV